MYSFNEECTVFCVHRIQMSYCETLQTRHVSINIHYYTYSYISYIHILHHSHCALRTLVNMIVDPVKLDQTPSTAHHCVCILFPPRFEHPSFRCVHDMSVTIFSAGSWVDPSQMSNHLIGEFRPLSKDRKAWIIICTQHVKYQIS